MPSNKPRSRRPGSSHGNGNGENVGCGTIVIVSVSLFIAYLLGMATAYVCFVVPGN